jgi:dihydroorotase
MGLVHRGELDLMTLVAKLTREPASFLRRADMGKFEVGTTADVTIFDPNVEWVVDPDNFVSKGRNTPLAGSVLKGKVMAVIAGGEIVYSNSAIRFN